METTLPLRLGTRRVRRNGEPTTLYLNKRTKTRGAEIARDRYGYSLSMLVNKLLDRESELKKGLLNARPLK